MSTNLRNYQARQTKEPLVALGLSGGVDSAVAACLLKEQNYDVTAVYLKCWSMRGCRAEQDQRDALKIALQLNIPFKVLDFRKEYKQKVMSYFVNEYQAGRTPNPDVMCNQVVKFGLFYDWAIQHDFSYIATGHYAQSQTINLRQKKRPVLLTSKDLHKDQTYFLHQIEEEQLPRVLFPIGHLLKKEVRQLAVSNELHVADKKDSVGICFVGDINVQNFLKKRLGEKPGDIVTTDGKKIGQHDGTWFYTVGQRHGFALHTNLVKKQTNWLDEQSNMPPLYVIEKKPENNQLVVGLRSDTMTRQFQLSNLSWINADFDWQSYPLLVRIRHTGQLVRCQLNRYHDQAWQVTTQQDLFAAAAGQFAVFYINNQELSSNTKGRYICLGGGEITAGHSS